MRHIILVSILFSSLTPLLSQEKSNTSQGNINITRQGFGDHRGLSTNLGFVNPKAQTDGSAYYFDNWDTESIIYTKNEGAIRVNDININLYDNTIEALYDENSIFTFDSNNIVKIIVNDKVFRFLISNGEMRIFEIIFNKGHSVYKGHYVSFTEAAVNPMLARENNKYLTKTQYYLYENGNLNKIKLSKRAFSKSFQSENYSADEIASYIKKAQLSLSKEEDLIKVLTYLTI